MRLRRRSNCAVNSGLIAIPTRRYSALTDYHSAGTSGLDRRGSLPSSVLRFTPLVRIERKVSQFESSRCDVRSMKFDTSIDKNHIKRLLFLVGILCVFTFSAISYSFYKVLKKKYSNWVSWFRDEMHHPPPPQHNNWSKEIMPWDRVNTDVPVDRLKWLQYTQVCHGQNF